MMMMIIIIIIIIITISTIRIGEVGVKSHSRFLA